MMELRGRGEGELRFQPGSAKGKRGPSPPWITKKEENRSVGTNTRREEETGKRSPIGTTGWGKEGVENHRSGEKPRNAISKKKKEERKKRPALKVRGKGGKRALINVGNRRSGGGRGEGESQP